MKGAARIDCKSFFLGEAGGVGGRLGQPYVNLIDWQREETFSGMHFVLYYTKRRTSCRLYWQLSTEYTGQRERDKNGIKREKKRRNRFSRLKKKRE